MKKILFITLVTLTAFSCSKEKRIEKNLWKGDGEWEIESYSYNAVSTYPDDNYSETYINCGTLTFNKNNTGIYLFNFYGDTESGIFTYSNTDDTFTWIIDGEAIVFDMTWKKNKLTLTNKTPFYYYGSLAGNSGSGTTTIVLEKD
ncbi:MAG TPA: hypothetical protein PLI97_12645 [Fluviicola sp.]|nr:hypothetical protein [Fluviicola sp.]